MKLELVAHWRLWWRRWSTWLAGVPAIIAGYLVQNPNDLRGLVAYVPDEWKPLASVLVSLIVFAVPVIVANLRQAKLVEARNDLAK